MVELARAEIVEVGARRGSLVDEAYAALKQAIRDNDFPPGYQGSEQEIAVRLGMSRTPVHEAIIRLQEDGLVRVLSKRGVLICPLAPQDIREIYEVVIAVESMAAELLAALPEASRAAVADQLEAATVAMDRALADDDLRGWAEADELFHRLLVERCGNGRLRRIAQTVTDQAHRARMLTLKLRARPVGSAQAHRLIIAAVRSGDTDEAQRSARAHRVAARDEIIPLIEHIGLRQL
ncbi:GntR family transcriptional regulator [Bosea sp. (in: a-proteobacteria)]|jgi:DNA-binding GntR family transcriptional regulator|uniref:GntR family transcriptional regulator n=1 Tax=Bosea sp. (in: a-proteobacteria) TaxID=1871050 RepID=UPI002DDD16A7|nr:GntR family transcriptional regulator [Bosea sp. (in: a-proteobacteria)]HEV2513598.1 GntR family transcriptional regulator [Bosea sp. (in: a-proteobacteria)]